MKRVIHTFCTHRTARRSSRIKRGLNVLAASTRDGNSTHTIVLAKVDQPLLGLLRTPRIVLQRESSLSFFAKMKASCLSLRKAMFKQGVRGWCQKINVPSSKVNTPNPRILAVLQVALKLW